VTTRPPVAGAPLAGVRIVDLSTVFSGPLCTALLADQGAAVIKVESPDGDTTRGIGPAKGPAGRGAMSAAYITANHGKRGIALDLKQPQALPIVHALLARADAVVNNYRPGVMERLGLGDAELVARHPQLVRLDITGFGADGPRAEDKAYDAVIQAVSGFAASHRDLASGAPHLLSSTVCDKLTALTAAQALTAALLARARDGRGRRVEVSMLEAALHFQWVDAMYNHVFIDEPPPAFPEFGATQRPWACADGYVATMTPQQAEFTALCTALGVPELAQDPRFASTRHRARHYAEMRAALEPHIARHTCDELEAACRRTGAPLARVNERGQVIDDPQVRHRGSLPELAQGADIGRVRLARSAACFDGQAMPLAGPAPRLGEHGEEILRELGYDAPTIAQLRASGVVAGS
jgi:crotonobetainyl-CoA:carnitine CoA-transferase CaiB-like acyl-CoA transferase